MDETTLIRRQLLDDLIARFESITCQLHADPTLTIEDAGALVSAACMDFNTKWEELLTRSSTSAGRSRLRLVMSKEPASITCPRCGMTSYNLNDVREGYCGNCHDIHRPAKMRSEAHEE
jgi:ribosomal protein L37E